MPLRVELTQIVPQLDALEPQNPENSAPSRMQAFRRYEVSCRSVWNSLNSYRNPTAWARLYGLSSRNPNSSTPSRMLMPLRVELTQLMPQLEAQTRNTQPAPQLDAFRKTRTRFSTGCPSPAKLSYASLLFDFLSDLDTVK